MATWQSGRSGRPQTNHWQDWINLLLAIWLFISPWVLNFGSAPATQTAGGAAGAPPPGGVMTGNAAWDAWVLGVIIGLVAISAIAQLAPWQEWVNLVLGVWVFIAPWILSFSGLRNAAWDHWIVGFLVFIFAIWNLSTVRVVPVDVVHAGDRPGRPTEPPGI
ncbi:MAG TPA: SPW repeat protein [Stellaceae bacterium]|nr:SPW repeat protein [Stellaceae bacterium]